jgi:hypothetical protein
MWFGTSHIFEYPPTRLYLLYQSVDALNAGHVWGEIVREPRFIEFRKLRTWWTCPQQVERTKIFFGQKLHVSQQIWRELTIIVYADYFPAAVLHGLASSAQSAEQIEHSHFLKHRKHK